MDIKKFIEKKPFLYHLTSSINVDRILDHGVLFSANQLLAMSDHKAHILIQKQKRKGHLEIQIDGKKYSLRDQRPISELALGKCLTDGWEVADYLYHLNDRVFMWPTIERLTRHFKRYQNEKPVIFRFQTDELLRINPNAKFSRLNSGATRANSHLGGKPPQRGLETFLSAENYNLTIGSVAEVTFENECNINLRIEYSNSPNEPFKRINA